MPRPQQPEITHDFDHPFWLNQPNVSGLHMPIFGVTHSIPWRAVLESNNAPGRRRLAPKLGGGFEFVPDIGWVRVVSITIGVGAEKDLEERRMSALIVEGKPDLSTMHLDVTDSTPAILRDVELARRSFEDTRRLVVDLTEQLRKFNNSDTSELSKLSATDGQITDRERALIASNIVEIIVRKYGQNDPGRWIEWILGVSESTRKRSVDKAIALGFLPPRPANGFRPDSWEGFAETRANDGRLKRKKVTAASTTSATSTKKEKK